MSSGGRGIGDSDNTAPQFGRMSRPIQKFTAFASPLLLGIPPVAWDLVRPKKVGKEFAIYDPLNE
jgi:hypothetical protein